MAGNLTMEATNCGYQVWGRYSNDTASVQGSWWIMGTARRAERVARRKLARQLARKTGRISRSVRIDL